MSSKRLAKLRKKQGQAFDIESEMSIYDRSVSKSRIGAMVTKFISNLGCAGNICKKLTYLFNMLYLLLSFALIIVCILAIKASVASVADKQLTTGVLVVGVFSMIVGAVGICGASMENRGVLGFYQVLLGLMMLVDIALGLYVLIHKGYEASVIARGWRNADNDIRCSIQDSYSCCGLQNLNGTLTLQGIPCPFDATEACLDILVNEYKSLYNGFGSICFVAGMLMLTAFFFSWALIRAITKAQNDMLQMEKEAAETVGLDADPDL